jgi:hypothetical protein
MLADVCLHSAPVALHYYLGSGSAAPVPVTNASQGQSVLSSTSGSVAVGP